MKRVVHSKNVVDHEKKSDAKIFILSTLNIFLLKFILEDRKFMEEKIKGKI